MGDDDAAFLSLAEDLAEEVEPPPSAAAPAGPPPPDPCRNQALMGYADFVQRRWAAGVTGAWLQPPHSFKAFLLSGEAGSGKSTALGYLRAHLRALGLESLCCVTATTHTAADLLGQGAQTYQSALGFSLPLCKTESMEAFVAMYQSRHGRLLAAWARLSGCPLEAGLLVGSGQDHGHSALSAVCPRCQELTRAWLSRQRAGAVPRAALCSLMVVDEYGMLTELDALKVLWAVDRFTLAQQAKTVIFAGSVSQLASPGGVPLWECRLFRRVLTSSTALLINRRQGTDFAYGRALSLMQFNRVTAEAVRLFDSRVTPRAHDPLFLPHVTRIYNSNDGKCRFNRQAHSAAQGTEVTLTLQFRREAGTGGGGGRGTDFATFCRELRAAHPKVLGGGGRGGWSESEGGRTVLWRLKTGHRVTVRQPGQAPRSGTLGQVTRHPQSGAEMLTVGGQTVPTCTFRLGDLAAVFFPVYPTAAINTFCAQGATLSEGLVYCPPNCYMRSPIKPSAYVAMSRVNSRERLWLSSNPFSRPGRYDFFPAEAVAYRKTAEMPYRQRSPGREG